MSMNAEYRQIGEQLSRVLGRPTIDGLYLPAPVADETFRDEFGFVLLSDGSVGPFYVSMGGILRELWRRHPDPATFTADPLSLLTGFSQHDLADRALALGAYNALSAALMRASGFEPPDRAGNSGLDATPPGAPIGMVGYFCPLVDKLTAQGSEVLVLEQAPERVPDRPGVLMTADPRDLRQCGRVLCTASTLINDSLAGLLATVDRQAPFELIGPSGSGLPDPLFARGVATVGGIQFPGREQLLDQLRRGESWGSAGRKYQLDTRSYPGLDELLALLG